MENVRDAIADDLSEILEDEFGQPITLISPSGVTYNVIGWTLLTSVTQDEFGETNFTNKPQVILRIRSLSVVPKSNENWVVKFADIAEQTVNTYMLEKAVMHGRSLGYIKLFLTKAVQSA